jgi:hypothetical protein
LNVSLLNDGGQRLLGQAARFEEARKIGALAQLRDAQLDRAGARLPIAVAIAVALSEPLRRTLAVGGAGLGANLQLHQSLGREADHLAQNIGVGVFSTSARRFIISLVIGRFLGCVANRKPTLPENRR